MRSPAAPAPRPRPVLRALVATLALHGIAFVAVGLAPPDAMRPRWLDLYDAFGFLPLQLAAGGLLIATQFRPELEIGTRLGLRRIGFGFLVLAVGSLVIGLNALDGERLPYLSWADLIFFFFYPALIVGLRSLPRVDAPRDVAQDTLGFLSVIIAFGALITFSFRFELQNSEVSTFQRALILATSSAQLLTLVALNISLERARRAPASAPMLLLFGALAASIVTDLVLQIVYSVGYAGINFGFPVAVAVNVAMMLVALRLLEHPLAEPEAAPGLERGLLPYSPLPIIAVSVLAVVAVWVTSLPTVSGSIWLVLGLVAVNLLLVIRDVRASRLAADALRRRTEETASRRLEALVRHGADAIVLIDDLGRTRFASARAHELFGTTPTQLDDTPLPLTSDHAEGHRFRAFLEDVRRAGAQPVTHVWTLHDAAGARRIETVGIDLRHEDAVNGIVLHMRDITEREDLQDRLRHAQKLEVAGRLAGGIAHDFNNVLTAVQAGAELARLSVPADSPAHADLETIEAAAQRGAALTRRLLTFVRQERIPGADVSIAAIVDDLFPLMQRLVGEAIRLRSETRGGTWIVRVDRAELEHVLFNLLSNARDAMPTGGEIGIGLEEAHLETAPTGTRWVIAPPPGRFARLTVRDGGHGMTDDVRQRMFDPFFTLKSSGRGTGLGLIGVRPLILGAGGGLAVDSDSRGTTVELLLPIVGETTAAPRTPTRRAPPARRQARVLLVEDDPAVRENLERLLAAHGFRCDCVPGAADARVRLADPTLHYDCVVSDVVMPGEDGLQLAAWIRSVRATVPVLLVSGHTGTTLDDPHTVGADIAFLRKPFSGAELAARIDALLRGRGPASGAADDTGATGDTGDTGGA